MNEKMNEGCKQKSPTDKKKDDVTVDFSALISKNVRGMRELDRDLFISTMTVPCIKCKASLCGKIQSYFRHSLLNRPKFKRIRDFGAENKLILLQPSIKSVEEFSTQQKGILESEGANFMMHPIKLTYTDFTFEEIIRKVLPEDIEEFVSSFETVGHIAHVNLKEGLLDFKHIIGNVLLDKNPNIKTVVNKTNAIEETFRFFKMELLAGEDRMFTSVQEHGCLFEFDYSKVYWNSRLQTEHQRIVKMLKSNDIVFDVFAGVGPFAIPAAKSNCIVYANDLNKVSYDALIHNSKLNKVTGNVKCFNMDGRDFLNQIVCKQIGEITHAVKIHIVMNLPALAPTFLDVFKEKYDLFDIPLQQCKHIIVHCYCFSKSKSPQVDAEIIVSQSIGFDISSDAQTHFVRRVAPNKVMMCVSFQLIWFESNAETCKCHSSTSLLARKRPVEGGIYPIVAEKSKRAR